LGARLDGTDLNQEVHEDGTMEKEKFELLRREYTDAMQDIADQLRKAKSFAELSYERMN
jgi:hypothetical protein